MSECLARIASALRALLTPELREVVDAQPAGVKLLSTAAAAAWFAEPGARFRIELGDVADSVAIIHLSPELAVRIVDRLCGGADDVATAVRPIAGIEQELLGEVLTRALPSFADALRGVAAVAPRGLSYVSVVDAAWLARPGDHVAVASLDTRSGPVSGEFAVALPLALVRGRTTDASDGSDAGESSLVAQHLRAIEIDITTRIAFSVSALDIATLREGTVIPTGHPSHGVVEVYAGGRRRFTGMLGREEDHVAVRVLREATEEASTHRPNRRKSAP